MRLARRLYLVIRIIEMYSGWGCGERNIRGSKLGKTLDWSQHTFSENTIDHPLQSIDICSRLDNYCKMAKNDILRPGYFHPLLSIFIHLIHFSPHSSFFIHFHTFLPISHHLCVKLHTVCKNYPLCGKWHTVCKITLCT